MLSVMFTSCLSYYCQTNQRKSHQHSPYQDLTINCIIKDVLLLFGPYTNIDTLILRIPNPFFDFAGSSVLSDYSIWNETIIATNCMLYIDTGVRKIIDCFFGVGSFVLPRVT